MRQVHFKKERMSSRTELPGYKRPAPGSQPERLYEPYRSTVLRAPRQTLIQLPSTLSEITGPLYGHNPIGAADNDLTRQCPGEPLGERIIVSGRIIDEDNRPIPNALVEIWQANSAGRYLHSKDEHPAPADPNFIGAGRTISDASGRYQFVTIMPGAYPWANHDNAWRPRHIHFSLFGPAFVTRLITQMYFPGDPLIPHDPILQSIPDEGARQRMVSRFNFDLTKPGWAIGYEFDIVLRGRQSTPFEEKR
jgi:protocatechuate 3,4-dioxygenase, beta subunit